MFPVNDIRSIEANAEDRPGIYKIYWIKNNVPQVIRRFVGEDKSGLLYVGEAGGTLKNGAGSVRVRLNNFRCSAFLNSTNHSGGLKYRTYEVIRQLIACEEIFAEVRYCAHPVEEEQRELYEYTKKYGEVPPLNG